MSPIGFRTIATVLIPRIKTAGNVAGKEIRDLFRDIRSMAITVAVPIVLFPALFLVLDTNMESQQMIRESNRTIAVEERIQLPEEYTTTPGDIASVGTGEAIAFLDRDGVIHYNDRSELSTMTARELQQILTAASTAQTPQSGATRGGAESPSGGLPANAAPTTPDERPVAAPPTLPGPGYSLKPIPQGVVPDATPGSILALAAVVPLFLLLAMTVSSLPAALDLGAGEKQRESLEFLLTSAQYRGPLFVGKAIAATTLGYFGTAAFVTGIVLAHQIVPSLLGSEATFPLTAQVVLGIIGTILLCGAVIATMQLTLSFLARSPREAQALFVPFLVIVSSMGYTAMLTDVWYSPQWMLSVPILNLGLLFKSIVLGATSHIPILWVFLENFGILSLFSYFGRRILHSEWVLRRS